VITRILLRSTLATATVFTGLVPALHSITTMVIWLLSFAVYLMCMLWWLLEVDHIDHRLLPCEPGPLGDEPRFPANYTETTGPDSSTFRFVGCKDKRCASPPPRKP
jgi:hypothetical protein